MANFVAMIDPNELAVRIASAGHGMAPPDGVSAADLLAGMPPKERATLLRMARVSVEYILECINEMEPVDP